MILGEHNFGMSSRSRLKGNSAIFLNIMFTPMNSMAMTTYWFSPEQIAPQSSAVSWATTQCPCDFFHVRSYLLYRGTVLLKLKEPYQLYNYKYKVVRSCSFPLRCCYTF